ncbi:MAG: aspartate-semialdehyde dehydrogenase [Atribacterota bacterium]|nr:aspartate-semialdehyde dehydrogenase [Atribacterota bacterium]
MKRFNIAVVGATGAVGEEMASILEERNFPINEINLFASYRSAGKEYFFKDEKIVVKELKDNSFQGIDIALFSGGDEVSKHFAPLAVQAGCVVIDNGKYYRMDPNVPLVVPEVNPEDVFKHQGIIANPNCSTIQMVVALKPIYDAVGIKKVICSTYQSVSGTGKEAILELKNQTEAFSQGKELVIKEYPHQIAFNVLPHIGSFEKNGYTTEELKMLNETRKILHADHINVSATTARVPVFRAHAEDIHIETEKEIEPSEARGLLNNFPGIEVIDDPEHNCYPLSLYAEGRDEVFVGRIRKDLVFNPGLAIWVVADNLRKGAALNAVQIAELLVQ